MRLVIQRVAKASVTIDSELVSEIGKGLMVLVGVEEGEEDIDKDQDFSEYVDGWVHHTVEQEERKRIEEIDEEISSIIHNGYDRTEKILTDHMDKLHELAQYLIKYEKIDGDKFNRLMEGTLDDNNEEPETLLVADEVKENPDTDNIE